MIKKFKNGKLKLSYDKFYANDDGNLSDNYYHDEMFMEDLTINQINSYQYLADFETGLVYELGSYLLQNPLKWLLDEITQHGFIYLYPCTKKHSKSLLQDLENGY